MNEGIDRRDVLRATLVGMAAVSAPASATSVPEPTSTSDGTEPEQLGMRLSINGRSHGLTIDSRTTLLDALRNHLGLTGTKKGCDHGQCGACTVLIGDERHLSCLTLAAMVRRPVTTIEGLAGPDGDLHPMQQAFIDQDAFQCGYCTPGQILSAIACVTEGHAGGPDEIREYMSGNLCRCAAYPHIVKAIEQAEPLMRKG